MKRQNKRKPADLPPGGKKLIRLIKSDNDDVVGDLTESYRENRKTGGALYGASWFWFQMVLLVKAVFSNALYCKISMVQNYAKASLSTIRKHEGFSFINILGPATGLSCFVLISAWVLDELSFDSFHENGKNIYRVVEKIHYSDHVQPFQGNDYRRRKKFSFPIAAACKDRPADSLYPAV